MSAIHLRKSQPDTTPVLLCMDKDPRALFFAYQDSSWREKVPNVTFLKESIYYIPLQPIALILTNNIYVYYFVVCIPLHILGIMSHLHGHPNKREQERQCTYNVTLRQVCATIVVVEKQWVLHILRACVCRLRYPACNAHAPYCHLWPAPLYNIFFKLSYIRQDFRKKNIEHKMCA
jgi:hypothetical protein